MSDCSWQTGNVSNYVGLYGHTQAVQIQTARLHVPKSSKVQTACRESVWQDSLCHFCHDQREPKKTGWIFGESTWCETFETKLWEILREANFATHSANLGTEMMAPIMDDFKIFQTIITWTVCHFRFICFFIFLLCSFRMGMVWARQNLAFLRSETSHVRTVFKESKSLASSISLKLGVLKRVIQTVRRAP